MASERVRAVPAPPAMRRTQDERVKTKKKKEKMISLADKVHRIIVIKRNFTVSRRRARQNGPPLGTKLSTRRKSPRKYWSALPRPSPVEGNVKRDLRIDSFLYINRSPGGAPINHALHFTIRFNFLFSFFTSLNFFTKKKEEKKKISLSSYCLILCENTLGARPRVAAFERNSGKTNRSAERKTRKNRQVERAVFGQTGEFRREKETRILGGVLEEMKTFDWRLVGDNNQDKDS